MGLMQSVRARRAAATSSSSSSSRRRHGGGVKELIEHKLETPVFLAVTVMMVLRATQSFSGGSLIMAQLLGPVWYPRFEVFTGIGLGMGSELLMTLAGRSWRSWKREALDVAGRTGLSRIARASAKAQAEQNARHDGWFAVVGACASLYTGISYLITNSRAQGGAFDGGAALTDLMTCAVITAVVAYLGIFRESKTRDDAQQAVDEIDAGMNDALMAAIDRFKRGEHTDADARFIAENLPAHKQAKFRRAVAKANTGRVWTTAQIRERLGIGRDASLIRDLNRKVAALARTAEHGLEKDTDGRTWLIPHAVVMEVWGEEMATHAAEMRLRAGHAADAPRTTDPRSVVENPDVPTPAPDNDPSMSRQPAITLASARAPRGRGKRRGTIELDGEYLTAAEMAAELGWDAEKWAHADPGHLPLMRDLCRAKRAGIQAV